tara:strand:- start:206 stop:1273 length:1068 start_codon:yes stop_codon:yes gene_type:complete
MRRKNSIVIKKVNNNQISKDKKILNFYNKFKSSIYKDVKNKSFALAVSGGADSLCLAYFGKLYSKEFKNKIHVLIVDHNIRKDSYKEAVKVKKILKKRKISSVILRWKGKIRQSNIQKNARNLRYLLISKYCLKKKIKYLMTAHHGDDQIENFFIRLFRGSGLTGLSSMPMNTKFNKKLKIVRPFLIFKKRDLKYVTLNYFKTFIKDPSNDDEKFLRIRVRKYKKSMEKEGLDTHKIIKTVDNLVSANQALNYYKNKSLHKHSSFLSKNRCLINKKIFLEEADEIIFKSFSDILSLVSGTYYPPRSKKIINLIERLKKSKFVKSTLGGCIIEEKDNFILISKEAKSKTAIYQLEK